MSSYPVLLSHPLSGGTTPSKRSPILSSGTEGRLVALGEGVAVRTRRDREGEMREGTSTDRLASNPRPYCQPSGRGCQLRNHRALPAAVKTNPRQLASLVGVHIAEELGHRSVVGLVLSRRRFHRNNGEARRFTGRYSTRGRCCRWDRVLRAAVSPCRLSRRGCRRSCCRSARVCSRRATRSR